MSSVPDTIAPPLHDEDEFRLGWRYVERVGPDGVVTSVQVGLTPEDVLHPQEEDFIVQNHVHHLFVLNLGLSIERLLLKRPGVRARVDNRIDWGHDTIRPHGPDVLVFDNGSEPNPAAGTIRLREVGSRPLVVFEVTSPSTRANDLGIKVQHYYDVGVPIYVIVDQGPDPERRLQPRLLGYQAGPERYEVIALDEQGRLHVEALGLVLALEDDWLCCYDEDGNVLANRVEIARRLADLEAELAAKDKELATEKKRTSDLEAELLAAKEELKRLRGAG